MPLCLPAVVARPTPVSAIFEVAFIVDDLTAVMRVHVEPGSVRILTPADAWGRPQPLPPKVGARKRLPAPKKALTTNRRASK